MRRIFLRGIAALIALSAATAAWPRGSRVGDLEIGQPFATPSLAGTSHGAAYLASLTNTGTGADRLVRASTPAAERVELHTMAVDAQGVMRMRETQAIELAPKASIQMRPGAGFHFMLMNLRQPLKEGATFPMTLEFERAGKVEVKVVVQVKARVGAASHTH